jgi:hypothetical protein
MNPTYVRSLLSRLKLATVHVAKQNNHKFYPKISGKIDNLSDDEVMYSINRMILYLQAPEYSYMIFRHEK